MEQINQQEFENILKDVRNGYRLLALYQKRILDTVKYIGNQYNTDFNSGWPKFSNGTKNGRRANIDSWSWDWLNLYFYEFNMGTLKIKGNNYHFKILHQADTGVFDKWQNEKISKLNVEDFNESENSESRLFFILSKESNGCPIQHILKEKLAKNYKSTLFESDWLAVPYNLSRFLNQNTIDLVIKDFNDECEKNFSISLLNKD